MANEVSARLRLSVRLIGLLASRPGWLLTVFLLLVCLVPFAGPTASLRGEVVQRIDPFGFSLLVPSSSAFGPAQFLGLAQLLLITAAIIDWRGARANLETVACRGVMTPGTMALAAALFYGFFLVLSLPLLARSSAFPGIPAIMLTMVDLMLRATALAWVVSFAMSRASSPRIQPLVCWIVAGAFHLVVNVTDVFLVAPQARELVSVDISTIVWHAVIAVAAITLHVLPLPSPRIQAIR
jgi:hypothetical protein